MLTSVPRALFNKTQIKIFRGGRFLKYRKWYWFLKVEIGPFR